MLSKILSYKCHVTNWGKAESITYIVHKLRKSPVMYSFPDGFSAAGATANTISNIRWGTDFLLKTVNNGQANSAIVYQVGNLSTDALLWQRPWDITESRPAFFLVPSDAGSDLLGPVVGALASAAIAIGEQEDKAYYTQLLSTAQQIYKLGSANSVGGPL